MKEMRTSLGVPYVLVREFDAGVDGEEEVVTCAWFRDGGESKGPNFGLSIVNYVIYFFKLTAWIMSL